MVGSHQLGLKAGDAICGEMWPIIYAPAFNIDAIDIKCTF